VLDGLTTGHGLSAAKNWVMLENLATWPGTVDGCDV